VRIIETDAILVEERLVVQILRNDRVCHREEE
jgi:hypothetical protein